MMKNFANLLFVCCLIFVTSCRDYTPSELAGTYVNYNYNYEPFLAEIPYCSDTLYIDDKKNFYSKFWGQGEYEIENSLLKRSMITFYYEYDIGQAMYHTSLGRDENGKVKIILSDPPHNHYYKKID
jgi:hypothetical protein